MKLCPKQFIKFRVMIAGHTFKYINTSIDTKTLPSDILEEVDFINIFNHHFSIGKVSKFSNLQNSTCAAYIFKNFENRTKIKHEI